MANDKTFLNLYWSLRKYVYASFPGIATYWNPVTRPSATADKFLMVKLQDDFIGKLSFSYPRIFCVSKEDPEGVKLEEFTSQVVEKFASEGSGLKTIEFWKQSTNTVIGWIRVEDVRIRPVLPYSEGFSHRAVDLKLMYGVEQRHL